MKFCCVKFEEGFKRNNLSSPNIRIVNFLPKRYGEIKFGTFVYLPNNIKNLTFFITIGYECFHLALPAFNINFCPFCGIKLIEFYKSETDANEIEGETFI